MSDSVNVRFFLGIRFLTLIVTSVKIKIPDEYVAVS
jgi:hypothetical protein